MPALEQVGAPLVRALSKGIGITTAGACGTVTYEDTVARTPDGWRITHRKVFPHRVPLAADRRASPPPTRS